MHPREQMVGACKGDEIEEQVLAGERPRGPAGKTGKESLKPSARRRGTVPQEGSIAPPSLNSIKNQEKRRRVRFLKGTQGF